MFVWVNLLQNFLFAYRTLLVPAINMVFFFSSSVADILAHEAHLDFMINERRDKHSSSWGPLGCYNGWKGVSTNKGHAPKKKKKGKGPFKLSEPFNGL